MFRHAHHVRVVFFSRLLIFLVFGIIFAAAPSSQASDADLKRGYESFLNKDYAAAVSILKDLNLSKAHDLQDYRLWALGRSQLELGDNDAALKNFEELLKVEPLSLFADRARVGIGRAYFEKGDAKRAADYFNARWNDLTDEVKGEALYYWGLAQISSGEKTSGIRRLKEAYINFPVGNGTKEIPDRLKEEGEPLVFSAEEWTRRGDRLFEAKNFSEALKAYDQALEGGGSVRARIQKGETLFALKRYREAIPYLEGSSTGTSLLHLGISHQKVNSDTAAIAAFEKAQTSAPGTVEGEESLYRLAMMAYDAGRLTEGAQGVQRLADQYPKGNFRDRGLWRAGWTAYRAGDLDGALKFLSLMEKGAADFPTQGKAVYWRARALEKKGNSEEAAAEFSRAAQISPYSYYGFMALKRLKKSTTLSETPEVPPEWKISKSAAHGSGSSSNLHFKKALGLYRIDLGKLSLIELQAAIKGAEGKPGELSALLDEARRSDAYFIPVLMAQKYWENFKPVFPNERAAEDYRATLQFPFAFRSQVEKAAKEFSLSPYLLVGLMRQESAFQPWVISSANAQGLMQMLPATARTRAKSIGDSVGDLLDPATNIRLGAAELASLLEKFSDNWIHAIAGYNAGPGRPPQWVAEFGQLEPDEFVEEIPFSETNLYVKLVLRNYWTYRTLYKS